MNIDQLKEHRKKVAERVRLFRLHKKLRQQEIIESLPVKSGKGFKTPQSLGKAICKLDNNLPKSPTKQRAVVNGLAKQVGLELSPKIIHNHEHFWPSILCDDSLDLTSPCWRGICVN